jgi:uncharacterized iron-regulated membrane protein
MSRVRRLLFTLHGWLGLQFGLWLFAICFSGALATLAPELEWLAHPELRIAPHGSIRWQATVDAVQAACPGCTIGSLSRGEDAVLDGQAWTAYVTTSDGRFGIVRVDPYAARVVRPFATVYLSRYIEQLHFYLYSPRALIGVYIVTALAIPLLFVLVSSLLFQRAWWRHAFSLRVGARRRWSWAQFHRVVGIWSFMFGLVIAVTGIWYLIEEAIVPVDVAYPSPPLVPPARLAAHGPEPPAASLDALVAAAALALPGLRATSIDLPYEAAGGITVSGSVGRGLVRDRANAVTLDPADATVVAIRRAEAGTWLSWWVDAADPLHFGYWGGLPTKALWCVLGLCLPALVLTGAYLSLRRSAGQAASSLTRLRTLPLRSWAAIPVATLAVVSCVDGYARLKTASSSAPLATGSAALGPWHADVAIVAGEEPAVLMRLSAAPGRRVNVKAARLAVRGATTVDATFAGAPDLMRADVAVPPGTREVTLHTEDWSGGTHRAKVRLGGADMRPASMAWRPPQATDDPLVLTVTGAYGAVTAAVFLGWLWLDRPRRHS